MDGHHVIAWILIGLVAGALAGRVVQGHGYGFLGDIVVGLIGAFLGGLVLHAITHGNSAASSFVGECIVAFLGAVLLLAVLRMLGRGKLKQRGMLAAFRMSRRL
jgi:uncharacterized membrane protein YeaQ/YmgE (transglycosylase-associated protein family)